MAQDQMHYRQTDAGRVACQHTVDQAFREKLERFVNKAPILKRRT
jgi:hypothetical protein